MRTNKRKPFITADTFTPKPCPPDEDPTTTTPPIHAASDLAHAAVQDDPILLRRYLEAKMHGCPVGVTGTLNNLLATLPRHRHAQAVEDTLDAWESRRETTPCAACGSTSRRWGTRSRRVALTDEPPAFNTRTLADGSTHPLCSWCDDAIAANGEAALRRPVLRVAGGAQGVGSDDAGIRLAYQVPELGNGEPWSHVNRDQCIAWVGEHVHPSSLIFTSGHADNASIPGLRAHVWKTMPRQRPAPQLVFTNPTPDEVKADLAARLAAQKERYERNHGPMRSHA